MSTSLTALLERMAWIGGAVALAIGVFALARRLLMRFAGWRPAELSLPANAPQPSVWSRGVESATVWLIGLALVGSGVLHVWWYGVDLDVVPAAQQRHEFVVLAVLAVSITALAVVSVVWRMGVSIITTGVLLSAYFSLLDQGTISRRPANEADLARCSIEIRMEDGTVGADVWVNGVLLGQTPLTVTLADWINLPRWLDAPTAGPDGRDAGSKRASRGPRWVPCVVRPDRRWTKTALPEGVYFVWAEIGGEPLISAAASGTNVSFDGVQWMASPILILGQSPRWQAALDRLLDQARARDYRVDSAAEWLAGLHSFGEAGWRTAMQTAENEPLLKELLDELLRRDLGLTSETTPDEAWAIFERLERQATEARDYQSDSRIGWSLNLLLPHLDPERLARYAVSVVNEMRWIPSARSWTHLRRGDQGDDWRGEHQHFNLSNLSADFTHFRRRDQLARLSFLTHAVWQMDEMLDLKSTDDIEDNAIERLVVPAMLRRASEYPEVRLWVMRLGGSLEDLLYQRRFRDWQQRRPDLDIRFDPQAWRMTQEDHSEAARRWRREHADEVLALADKLSLEESPWTLRNFAFVLSDADGSAESLAARYWPRFRDRVAATSWPQVKRLEALWRYLFLLEPFSTLEMYVEAWRVCGFDLLVADDLRLQESEIVQRLSHEKRKAIIAALTTEAQARLENARTVGSRRQVAELEETLRQIPSIQRQYFASAAQKALQQFPYREDQSAGFDSVAKLLTVEIPAEPELRELFDSPDPKKRLLGVRVMRTHPAPHIRPLLSKLLDDGDAAVKDFANETQTIWQRLATEAPQKFSTGEQSNPKR